MKSVDPASYGFVLSGGGTRCAYQVGALVGFAEVHGIRSPKVLAAISGGAAAGMFFLAGRFKDMYDWAHLFDDHRFISWKRFVRGPIMDIDFLVDGILRVQAPELEQELAKVPTKRFIAATKFPHGSTHWFDNEPVFEQLRATKTMPGVSKEGVEIDGTWYADGCLSTSINDCVAKVLAEGAERVIVIDNGSYGRPSLFTRELLRFGSRTAPDHTKRAVERFRSEKTEPFKGDDRVIVCRSEKLPSRHGLVRAHDLNRATIERGYADAARLRLT